MYTFECIGTEFESYVISYRTKTRLVVNFNRAKFESYVISYRTKTEITVLSCVQSFESYVISYRTKTRCRDYLVTCSV